MNSNAVPTNRLKLVRCSLEDPQTRKIAARMGMSVAQFMTSLGYPQPHGSVGDLPTCIVWPKHTDFEIRDPYASVYRYEPRDNSWSLRFRALGCYNVLPRLPSEPVEENQTNAPLSFINNPSQLTTRSDLESKSDGNSPAEKDRLHSLLKSRLSASSNLELPSETITQAERNKLLDDLRLTDSEEEDESNSKPCAKNEPSSYNPNPTSLGPSRDDKTERTTEEEGTFRSNENEPDRLQNSLDPTAVPTATTTEISNVIDVLRDPFSQVVCPPPLVSPLSVMGDDAPPSDRPCRTPLLQDTRSANAIPCPGEMETGNLSSNNRANNRVGLRKFSPEDLSSNARQAPDKPATFNGPLVQKQLMTTNLPEATSHSESQTRTFTTIRDDHVDPDAQNRSPAIQSNFTQAVKNFKSKLAPVQGKDSAPPPFDTVTKSSDYIRRLLMESEAFLAAKEDLRITELSPLGANPWKFHDHSMFPDKENVVAETAEDMLNVASRPQFTELDKTRETSTPLSTPNNFTKQVLCAPAQPETRRTREVPDITAHTDRDRAQKAVDNTGVLKGTDEFPISASQTAASSVPKLEVPTTPLTLVKRDDHLPIPDSVLSSTSKTKNSDVRKRNQKSAVETHDAKSSALKSDSQVAKSPELEHKRSGRKGASRPPDSPTVSVNDTASSVSMVPDDERPMDRTCMPPPVSEGSGSSKRASSAVQKANDYSIDANNGTDVIRSSQPDGVAAAARLQHEELSNASSTVSSRVAEHENKLSTESETSPPWSSTCGTASVSREIPDKRWVFSNVALKKVRSKLKSVVDESSPAQSKDGTIPSEFLDKIRAALLSICSSRQPSSPSEVDRNGRSRTLTGVLLVPSRAECLNIHPPAPPNPVVHTSPLRQDTATMTSPSLAKIFTETLDVAIQYALSPMPQSEQLLSGSNNAGPAANETSSSPVKCSQCRVRLDQVPRGPVSATDLHVVGSKVAEYLLNEERGLQNSTVEIQLDRASECKNNASRCWKTLVGAVSDSQSGLRHTGGGGRSHLLLSLNDLHLYPVYLLQGVRHYLAAAHLLHTQGDTTRAVELCAEATAQLDHIGRRLQRVESKLTRYRVQAQQGTSDLSEGITTTTTDRPTDVQARAKRDASWIHLWYYVLARIRAMIRSHEYQLRLIVDASLLDEMENDPGLSFSQEPLTGSSHTCGTGDSKADSNKSSIGRASALFSPSVRPSPSGGPVELKPGKPAQIANGSLEPGRVSPEDKVPIRTSTMDRIQRLLKLNGLMRRAAHDWNESEKLAFDVPRLPDVSAAQNTLLTRLVSSSDPISASSIDFIIGHATGGAFPTSQYTNVITLLCFIDGVVKLHEALVEQLKRDRTTDDRTAVTTVTQEAPAKATSSGKQPNSLDAPRDASSASLVHSATGTPTDPVAKKSSVQTVKECIPSPDEPVPKKKHKKIRCKQSAQVGESVDRSSSSISVPPVEPETERVNHQPRGKHKPSDPVSSGKTSKRGKRIRLLESDDPKLWDSSVSSGNPATTVGKSDTGSLLSNKAGGYLQSQTEIPSSNRSLESSYANDAQPMEKSVEKPKELTKLDDTTRRNLSDTASRQSSEHVASNNVIARSTVNQVAGRPFPGIPGTPNEHDSQVETTSPDYTASTPSPPPMRPRSKSLAPTSSTRRACNDSGSEVDTTESEKRKRRNHHNVESEKKDWSDDNTYQPKRVRTSGSGKSYQTTQSGMESPSPDSSPFPSYRPSIPDELDKARRHRRSASVGRSLLHKPNTEAGHNAHATVVTTQGYDPTHPSSRQGHNALNGAVPNDRSNAVYSHLKTAYTSSKVNAAGKSEIPPYYEGWLNQSQSQIPASTNNKGQNHNKYYDLQKRYGKSKH